MKNSSLFALSLVSLVTSFSVQAEDLTGTIYALGSNKTKVLYTLVSKSSEAGVHKVFYTPKGDVAIIEDAKFANGEVIEYSIEHKLFPEKGSFSVRDGKVNFTYTKNGKTEIDSEDVRPNLTIGVHLVTLLRKNWDLIMKGGTLETRYAALERKETVGFKFFKIEEKLMPEFGLKPVVLVKMKPTSMVISALVDPIIFIYGKDGSRLLQVSGRTQPKILQDGKWKDLDADIVYTYAAPAALAPALPVPK